MWEWLELNLKWQRLPIVRLWVHSKKTWRLKILAFSPEHKTMINIPTRDDEHPRPVHMKVPHGLFSYPPKFPQRTKSVNTQVDCHWRLQLICTASRLKIWHPGNPAHCPLPWGWWYNGQWTLYRGSRLAPVSPLPHLSGMCYFHCHLQDCIAGLRGFLCHCLWLVLETRRFLIGGKKMSKCYHWRLVKIMR